MHFLRLVVFLIAHETLRLHLVTAHFGPMLNDGPEDELELELEPINGTSDYRINITIDLSGKPWYDDRKEHYRCVRPAKCEKLQNSTCFGSKIQYKYTSVQLSNEESQENSLKKLYQLEAFRNIPECWAVIQPFLCAVYMPKCIKSKNREYVYLPSLEMCRVASEKCRVLYDTDFLPRNLKCNEKVFPCKNCNNDVREMKFNATGQCMSPLVPTDSSINQYPDIEGCGLQCKDPMYTEEEHESVHALIFWGTIICLVSNSFVIATFLIHDWKHSKHPAWNLFYISLCFLCNWLGWMLQFIPDHREDIVCRRDGTLRYSEPSGNENLACIVPFFLIYYFLIAANVWFAIFTYAWYLQTKDRGSIRDRIDKESFYLHFIAWALPFVLTVTIIVLSEVDGNSIMGICFVGYRDRVYRTGLVLVPVGILSFGVSIFFSFKGILNLDRFKRGSSSNEESKKLNSHILGMGIRTMLVVFFLFAFFMIESYEVRNAELWAKSLNDLIICKIKESYSGDMTRCKLQNRPSVAILQLRLICLFCINLVVSSWCWTCSTLNTWKRFIKRMYELFISLIFYFLNRKIGQDVSEDGRFTKPKHRIIADAYAKRMDDVISVSYQNSYSDPAGLNFDMNNLNAAGSDAMGATLTNYLPNIINRRNAVTSRDFIENNGNCASSCVDNNSEISWKSVSVRHLRVESRRNSIDSQVSQVSVKVSETNIKATLNSHSQKHKSVKMKAKRRQRNFFSARQTIRRASSSSVESQRITNQMKNIKYKYPNVQVNPIDRQIERRSACTPAEINAIKMRDHFKQIPMTSDEDQRTDDPQTMHIIDEPPNMLVPFGMNLHQQIDSGDSLDTSHDMEIDPMQILKSVVKNGNEQQLETFLMNSSEKQLKNLYQIGIEQARSKQKCGKNQRYNNMYAQKKMDDQTLSKLRNGNDSATSMSSSMEDDLLQPIDRNRNSLSDHSINRQKAQSQNSKRSCDIGIQAYDYDITLNTRKQSKDDYDKDNLPEKLQTNYRQDDDEEETHQLLPNRKRDGPQIVRRENLSGRHLSGSEMNQQMKKLLFPDN